MEERKPTVRSLLFNNLMTLVSCLSVVMTVWCQGPISSLELSGSRGFSGPWILGSGFYNIQHLHMRALFIFIEPDNVSNTVLGVKGMVLAFSPSHCHINQSSLVLSG